MLPVEIPISKYFSSDRLTEIERYAKDRITSRIRGLRTIREEKVSKWRKIYMGVPREKTKSFPWQNSSNTVVKLVRSFTDQLVAKIVMASIAMDPIFVAELAGEFEREERAEEQRRAIQEWMALVSLEPGRLNLLPKYTIWIRNVVKYGFGAIKLLPQMTVEQVAKNVIGKTVEWGTFVRHDGPVAYPIMFEDFLMASTTLEFARDPLIAQRAIKERFQIQELLHDPSFDRQAVIEALKNPTRQGPSKNRREIEDDSGARTDSDPVNDQWDLYECYFPYMVSGKTFRIISTCIVDESGETPKFLKHVFNWLPENLIPFTGAWLAADGENSYSPGFCELLADYQEEVTAIHNRRGDASTLANTNVFRIGSGTQLDTEFSIYPNALMPLGKDDFEVMPLGRDARETIADETMVLQEAADLVGIGPSSSGQGAGTVNKKGAYSAMGTFAVMQEGNTRPNLNTTEFRISHYTFGRAMLLYYANFGVSPEDVRALGKQGKYLEKALENVKQGRIILPIRAATGSVNKEIEKQNLMLLLNNTRAHWQMVNQLLQQASNPMAPPEIQDYLLQVIMCSNRLMQNISRDFGETDPSSIIPEPLGVQDKLDAIKKQADQAKQQQQQPQLGAPPNGQGAQPQLPQTQAPGAPAQGTDQSLLQ